MSCAFSYIVKRDFGFAPNPFYGVLTLATCKPLIRKYADVGDYVIGNAPIAHEHKLIFMAKVGEISTFDFYWEDIRFQCKKPKMNGSRKKLYGDNIYHRDELGNWIQSNSHHSLKDGSVNLHNLHKDTGTTVKVLICNQFFYFGKSMFNLPQEYCTCIHRGRGHHRPENNVAELLWRYLGNNYPMGMINIPNQFNNFDWYDGKS